MSGVVVHNEHVEIDELKARVDLASLVERDLGPAARETGDWSLWRCPFHDDHTPSFGIKNGTYYCFGCGASGDHIEWLEQYHHLAFHQALERLAKLAGVLPPPASEPDSQTDRPPNGPWQARAHDLVTYAQDQLWTESGWPGLAYLRSGGLTDDTIRHFRLGWLPAPDQGWYEPPQKWGLQGGKQIWLPRGVVIPGEVGGQLWYVKIRRFTPGGQPVQEAPRYIQPRGARTALFGADELLGSDRPLLLCEGERDAMLAWQELHDLVDVASVGGAGKHLPEPWAAQLRRYPVVLVAYDADEAGARGASHLKLKEGHVQRLKVPQGGDLTGFHQAGGGLRHWVRSHLGAPRDGSVEWKGEKERLEVLESELNALLEQIRTCRDGEQERALIAQLYAGMDAHDKLWKQEKCRQAAT